MSLLAIEQHVARGAWEEALDIALEEWRRTRVPAYANLVEALAPKCARAAISMESGWFQSKWLGRARSTFAGDVGPLMECFALELSTEESRGYFDQRDAGARMRAALERENASIGPEERGPFMAVCGRIAALAERLPDPRMATGLVRFLKIAPVAATGALEVATYGPVYDFVASLGDVRVLPDLEALPASARRDRVIEALRSVAVQPLSDEKAVQRLALDLGYTPPAAAVDVEELLALVASEPDDDTPRAVLGDRWLEAGDPRGEFVSLQLRAARGEASSSDLERMATLQANGEKDWLGEIALVAQERRFHRGFLDEIALAPDGTLTPARWDAVAANPKLATVRVLRMGAATADLYRKFLYSPALRSLQEAEIASLAILRTVLEKPPPKLRRIELKTSLVERATVRSIVDAGFERITVTFGYGRLIADAAELLSLATEKTSIVLRGIDAHFEATRPSGIELSITSRDAFVVSAALSACPGAVMTLRRPHGATLYGPNGDTKRLANRLDPERGKHQIDASWTAMLARSR
ncbi:MAG: TIGR02996 domain-containing protein [Labilithrix sp.]